MRGKIMGKNQLLLSLTLSMLLGACSDGPEQYNRGQGAQLPTGTASIGPEIGTTTVPEDYPIDKPIRIGKIEIPKFEIPDDIDDAQVKKNSSQPLVYSESFGGISFTTDFNEAKDILSEPLGVRIINGNKFYFYREGIIVIWREQEPRVPEVVLVQPSYLGGMPLDQELGELKLGSPVVKHFADDDGSGKSVVRKYFNILEGKDASYDCLQTRECKAEISEDKRNHEFELPSASINISVDRKIVNYLVMTRKLNPGNLNNSFDIVKQNIPFKDKNNEAKAISFGEIWEDAQKLIDGDSLTTVSTDSFTVQHDGVFGILSKERYEREYLAPDASEILEGLVFVSPYNKKFMFNGQYLNYKYDMQNKIFKLSKSSEVPSAEYFLPPQGISLSDITSKDDLKKIDLKFKTESKEITLENVQFPILFEDGSVMMEEPSVVIPDETIAAIKAQRPDLTEDQIRAALEGQEKQKIFSAQTGNIFVDDRSSQTFGLGTTLLDQYQINKVRKENLELDMKQIKVDYLVALSNFIKNELKAEYPDKIIFNKIDGLYNKSARGRYSSVTLLADFNTGEGKIYSFNVDKQSGDLGAFQVFDTNADFNKLTYPALNQPLNIQDNIKMKSFAGIKLGDAFIIKDFDKGRREATITSLDGQMSERSGFEESALRSNIYDGTGKIRKETLSKISISDLGISLMLAKDAKQADVYRVAQISNSFIHQKIDNLCGLTGLDLKVSTPTTEVVAKINRAISDKRQQDPSYKCVKFEQKRGDSSSQLFSMSFPEQAIKLYFSNNQFSSIGIYTTVKEALKSEGQQ